MDEKIPKNSGKAPSIQLYYKDLYSDIVEHPNDMVGAWIKILCKIWHENRNGKVTLNITQLSRIIGENEAKTQQVIKYLEINGIADIKHEEPCNVTDNASVTITNRRAERDSKLREQNKLRQERFRRKHANNAPVTPMLHRSSSSTSVILRNASVTRNFSKDEDLAKRELERLKAEGKIA